MAKDNAPRDENLRLVLSPGHDEWLEGEARRTWRDIKQSTVIAALCLCWLLGIGYWVFADIKASMLEQPCYILQEGDVPDPDLPPEIRDNICPPASESEAQESDLVDDLLPILGFVLTFLSVITLPVSMLELLKLRKRLTALEAWTEGHEAFLKRYGRR